MSLRPPQTTSEHAALRAFCDRVKPDAEAAIASIRRRHRVDRAPWKGSIHEGPSGPEAVVVIEVWLDPTAERVVAEERAVARRLREHFISRGFYVGGVACDHNQVWLRSSPIARVA